MATTMVEPFAPWLRDFNQILHNQAGGASAFIPPADLLVDDDGVTVYMDVPALRAENLDIELENDVLTIRGERPFPYAREDGKGPVRRIERGFGRFERTLRVPPGLDPATVAGLIGRRGPHPPDPQAGDTTPAAHRDSRRGGRDAARGAPAGRDLVIRHGRSRPGAGDANGRRRARNARRERAHAIYRAVTSITRVQGTTLIAETNRVPRDPWISMCRRASASSSRERRRRPASIARRPPSDASPMTVFFAV